MGLRGPVPSLPRLVKLNNNTMAWNTVSLPRFPALELDIDRTMHTLAAWQRNWRTTHHVLSEDDVDEDVVVNEGDGGEEEGQDSNEAIDLDEE